MISTRNIAISSLLLSALILSACNEPGDEVAKMQLENPRPASIVQVTSSEISLLRSYPGTLEASKQAELAFRVSGQLRELPARAGIIVEKGELLARLDDADYRNTLEKREARYELAKIQYAQVNELLKKNLASQLQYEKATAEMKSARAVLDQARDNLQHTRLLAPFDGIVARVHVENYQAIHAKIPIIWLQDDQRLDIRFGVPESLIGKLKRIEDPAVLNKLCGIVRFSARPDNFYRACYKEHESIPDLRTRSYATLFSLEKITDFTALPGMTASIDLNLSDFTPEGITDVLLVPLESVFEYNRKSWVWRVDSQMRAQRVAVEIGRFEGKMLEITSGVMLGDRIIAAGVGHVREGMLVKPLSKERGL